MQFWILFNFFFCREIVVTTSSCDEIPFFFAGLFICISHSLLHYPFRDLGIKIPYFFIILYAYISFDQKYIIWWNSFTNQMCLLNIYVTMYQIETAEEWNDVKKNLQTYKEILHFKLRFITKPLSIFFLFNNMAEFYASKFLKSRIGTAPKG